MYYRHQNDDFTLVAIWVNDGLVCSSKSETINEILEYLNINFEMRSFPATRFVGKRNRLTKEIFLSQPHFISKILAKFNMSGCHPKIIPADPHARLLSLMSPTNIQEQEEMSLFPYREAVGCHTYITTITCPEIAYAVGQVSQFSANPGRDHWGAVKQIIAYLAGTPQHGICYGSKNQTNLLGYIDADYAGDLDTRCSTTGFVFTLNGGPVAWGSTLQRCTALSTTES